MNRRALALALSAVVVATGCAGESSEPTASNSTGSTQSDSSPSSSPTPEEPPAKEYQALGKAGLEAALLSIQDLPPGYSQDPPAEPGTKTFCDYKVPVDDKVEVSRDFTKGGGMSSELLSVRLRQFESPEDAERAFDALANALETCRGEVFEGSRLQYTPMSAPEVGDASLGLRIAADGFTLLQNFVLVGPTIVVTGGGGAVNANADEISNLLQAQVRAYEDAATS